MSEGLKAAHRELTDKVMGRAGVTGTAIGEKGGKPCLKVYVGDDKGGRGIPRTVGGYRVVVEKTGAIHRL